MDAPSPHRVAAHPAGARRAIPAPRPRWLAGGALPGGWETNERLQLEFLLRPLWIAAPLQVHPTRTERVRVVQGRLGVTTDAGRRTYRAGQVVEIPAGVRHTFWNAGLGTLRLVDDYQPPLRTTRVFDELSGTDVRRPRQLRRSASTFRMVASIGAALAVGGAILGIVARRRRG